MRESPCHPLLLGHLVCLTLGHAGALAIARHQRPWVCPASIQQQPEGVIAPNVVTSAAMSGCQQLAPCIASSAPQAGACSLWIPRQCPISVQPVDLQPVDPAPVPRDPEVPLLLGNARNDVENMLVNWLWLNAWMNWLIEMIHWIEWIDWIDALDW